jgi:hypothetical protein
MTAPTYEPRKEQEFKPAPVPREQPEVEADIPFEQLLGHMKAGQMSRGEEDRPRRKDRIPFGQYGKQYAVTEIPGYHLHGIVDWHPQMADRINQALRAGYQFVTQQEVEVGYAKLDHSSDLSDRVSRTVGTRPSGEPITEYLMKIPTEFWMEHQQFVADHANKVDAAIKRGAVGGRVGTEGRYVPAGSPIKIASKLQDGDPDFVLREP